MTGCRRCFEHPRKELSYFFGRLISSKVHSSGRGPSGSSDRGLEVNDLPLYWIA